MTDARKLKLAIELLRRVARHHERITDNGLPRRCFNGTFAGVVLAIREFLAKADAQ